MDVTHSFMSQQNNRQLQLRHWAAQSNTIEVASADWRPLPRHTLALRVSFISFLATSGLFKSNHIVTVVQNSHYNLTPLTTKTPVPMLLPMQRPSPPSLLLFIWSSRLCHLITMYPCLHQGGKEGVSSPSRTLPSTQSTLTSTPNITFITICYKWSVPRGTDRAVLLERKAGRFHEGGSTAKSIISSIFSQRLWLSFYQLWYLRLFI